MASFMMDRSLDRHVPVNKLVDSRSIITPTNQNGSEKSMNGSGARAACAWHVHRKTNASQKKANAPLATVSTMAHWLGKCAFNRVFSLSWKKDGVLAAALACSTATQSLPHHPTAHATATQATVMAVLAFS